jgi:NADH-quinone oxidoreductase subunit F
MAVGADLLEKKTPQVLFRNRHPDRIATLDEYRASGGYEALAEALKGRSWQEVDGIVLEAGLLGRGGAGFPAGKKWLSIPEDAPFPRYIVANADEMEPGTFKDRVLLEGDPFATVEAMTIAAYATGASQGYLYIRAEYPLAVKRLHVAIGKHDVHDEYGECDDDERPR